MSDLSTLITNSQLLLLINLKNTIDKHLELCILNPDLNLGSFVTGQSSVYSSMLQNILKCIQQSGMCLICNTIILYYQVYKYKF